MTKRPLEQGPTSERPRTELSLLVKTNKSYYQFGDCTTTSADITKLPVPKSQDGPKRDLVGLLTHSFTKTPTRLLLLDSIRCVLLYFKGRSRLRVVTLRTLSDQGGSRPATCSRPVFFPVSEIVHTSMQDPGTTGVRTKQSSTPRVRRWRLY